MDIVITDTENAKQYLKDNPDVCKEIENKVRVHFGLQGTDQPQSAEPDEEKSSKKGKAKESESEQSEE